MFLSDLTNYWVSLLAHKKHKESVYTVRHHFSVVRMYVGKFSHVTLVASIIHEDSSNNSSQKLFSVFHSIMFFVCYMHKYTVRRRSLNFSLLIFDI